MEEKEQKKLSYEELENIAHQLSEQSRQLYNKLQEANMTNAFKRLDYLFKVVENSSKFPEEFINKCTEEIISGLTVTESESTEGED